MSLGSGGGTNFRNAISKAIELVGKSKMQNPNVATSIVFVTDGEDDFFQADSVIPDLAALGTKVFAFAIGKNSECKPEMKKMAESTGATCEEVKESATLETALEQVFLSTRTIESVSLRAGVSPLLFDFTAAHPL